MPSTFSRRLGWASVAAAAALALSACGGDGSTGSDNAGSDETIVIGAIPGWNDQTGMAYLYKNVLEDNGYDVEVQTFGDNAPVFLGLAQGDIDMFASAWTERTMKSYWDEYGDDLEDLGTYYDDAKLFLAVPEYTDVDSIEDLSDHADELGNEIVGIEPGAGLTMITEEEVIPHYELDKDFEFTVSSTSAMLSTLDTALDQEKDVVVTLWTPFWAYESYDVKELEDPDNIYGDPEALHAVARTGFAEEYPDVARMIENFSLTGEEFGELEDLMTNEFDDEDEAAVQAWMEDNQDIVDQMVADLTGE